MIPGKDSIAHKTIRLTQAALASTLFYLYIPVSFGQLNPVPPNTTSNFATTDPQGYNFVGDATLSIVTNSTTIGTTGGISIDNNNGVPGSPYNVDVVFFPGSSLGNAVTVQGTVGPTNPITMIEVQGTLSQVTFAGNVAVGSGNLNFDGNANVNTSIILNSNVNVAGSIDNLNTPGIGNIQFNGSSIITGTIGASNALNALNLKGMGSTVSFQNNVAGTINFNMASTAAISDGVTITGVVDNPSGTPGTGTLQWLGGGTLTGSIGPTARLALVTVDASGSPFKTVQLQGPVVNANSIVLNDDGSGIPVNGTTLILNNPAMALTSPITVSTNQEDTLNIFNAATLTGNLGATGKAFYLIQVGQNANTTINGNIYATTTAFFGPHILTLANGFNINGNVDSAIANQGILDFAGASTVTGSIGATNKLNAINLQGAADTVNFQGNINVGSGNLNFASNANATTTASISNNVTITGNVDNTTGTAGNGILAFLGNGTLLGTVGATNSLAKVTINQANSAVNFYGNIDNGTPIIFTADAIANMGDGITISGDIDNTTGATAGTVQFLGNALVKGSPVASTIGATNGLVTLNILGAGKTVTFDNTAIDNNTPINFLANGTALFQDTETLFNVDNKTSAPAGTLVFQQGGTVGSIGATNPLLLVSVNTLGGANVLNINGAMVNANNINVVGAGGTTLNFDNGGGGVAINGNITTNNNGIDTINFDPAGNTTMVGNIGSPANPYGNVLLSTPSTTLSMTGNIFANNTEFNAANTTLQLSNGASVFGPITTSVTDRGILTFLGNSKIGYQVGSPAEMLNTVSVNGAPGTTVNLDAPVYTENFNVNNGGTLQPSNSGTVSTTTPLTIFNGILSIPNRTTFNIDGGLTLNNANATLQLNMGANLTTPETVVTTGVATVTGPGNLTLLNPAFSPGKTTTIPIVVGGGGSNYAPAINITNGNNFLTTFSTQVSGNTLNLVITSIPLTTFANQPNTAGVAGALDQIALSGIGLTGILEHIIGQLSAIGNAASLNFDLSTLAPVVDGALVAESFAMKDLIYDAIADRLERKDLSQGKRNSNAGISSGDGFGDKATWVKVIRYHANQQKRDGVQGYKAQTLGVVAGGDAYIREDILLGGALSASNLDAQDKLLPNIKTNADSYQLTVYGSKDFHTPLYIDGLVSVAYNQYTTERAIVFGNINALPRGDYHGWQWGAKGELGYVFDYVLGGDEFHAIPIGTLFYSYLDVGSYVEHGAGTANQNIASSDFDALIAGLGVKLVYDFGYDQRIFQLQAYALALYDFIDDKMEITSQFTGGGPSFVTAGFRPAKESLNVGGTFTLFSRTNWNLMLNYDLNIKENYCANAGYLRALYEW